MTSQFHNLTVDTIVDRLGALEAQLADLKADDEDRRRDLIACNVEAVEEGDLFRATVTEALRQSLDTDHVEAEMDDRWYASHCKIAVNTTVRVTSEVDDHLLAESLI